jgi:hypothetical protein
MSAGVIGVWQWGQTAGIRHYLNSMEQCYYIAAGRLHPRRRTFTDTV